MTKLAMENKHIEPTSAAENRRTRLFYGCQYRVRIISSYSLHCLLYWTSFCFLFKLWEEPRDSVYKHVKLSDEQTTKDSDLIPNDSTFKFYTGSVKEIIYVHNTLIYCNRLYILFLVVVVIFWWSKVKRKYTAF